MTNQLDTLQVKVDQLLHQLEEEKVFRGNLLALNEGLQTRVNELVAENQKQEEKINILMASSTRQEQEIHLLKNKSYADDLIKTKARGNTETKIDLVDINDSLTPRLPPSSCRQLSNIGHYLDGIYLVANPDTNRIETVFCEFGSSSRNIYIFNQF